MFKVKLNPQTAITVQSALPKIIIAMILVTFSYAIAGLLIDLMYVVFALLSILGSQFLGGLNVPPTTVFTFLTKGLAFQAPTIAGVDLPGEVNFGLFGMFVFLILFIMIGSAIAFFGSFGLLGGALASIAGIAATVAAAATGIGGLILIIILAVLAIVLLFIMVKTLWTLLQAYVNVLLLTIFAPFQIMAGVLIPSLGFGSWLRGYISKLAIFVTVSGLFFLSFVFVLYGIKASLPDSNSSFLQVAAQIIFGGVILEGFGGGTISNDWPPLLGGAKGATGLLFMAVSFVLFTTIPKAAKLVEAMIKGQEFNYGSAIGEAIQPVQAAASFHFAKVEQKDKDQKGTGRDAVAQFARAMGWVK